MARGSDPDGMAVARLMGRVAYVLAHKLPREQAIAELRAISDSPRLLAEAAGVIAGASKWGLCHWPTELGRARLLVEAGADRDLLPQWVKTGIERTKRGSRRGEPLALAVASQDEVDQVLGELLEGLQ